MENSVGRFCVEMGAPRGAAALCRFFIAHHVALRYRLQSICHASFLHIFSFSCFLAPIGGLGVRALGTLRCTNEEANWAMDGGDDRDYGHAVECWGGVMKGDGGEGCDKSFKRGRRHMCARRSPSSISRCFAAACNPQRARAATLTHHRRPLPPQEK